MLAQKKVQSTIHKLSSTLKKLDTHLVENKSTNMKREMKESLVTNYGGPQLLLLNLKLQSLNAFFSETVCF